MAMHLYHLLRENWLHCDQCYCEKKPGDRLAMMQTETGLVHNHAWFKGKEPEFPNANKEWRE